MALLKDVLVDEMKDLLHAEGQLVKALPKMARAAKSSQLKTAFQNHLEDKPCRAMMGLVEEGQETITEGKEKEPVVADIELIAAAQKVEHYEMSGYGTVRAIAEQLGETRVARLFSETLAEEEKADKLLTSVCEPILKEAANGSGQKE